MILFISPLLSLLSPSLSFYLFRIIPDIIARTASSFKENHFNGEDLGEICPHFAWEDLSIVYFRHLLLSWQQIIAFEFI